MPNTGRIHDRDLLDFLEGREPQKYQGEIWRVTWSTRNPLVGSRAGGRWHPPNSFEALYTSVGEDGTLAEVYFHLSRAPVFSSSDMQIYCLAIETVNTIALDSECLSQLGIDEKNLGSMEYERSQAIGAAAHFLEFDGILVSSARSLYSNLVLFLDRIDPSKIGEVNNKPINWPAWREAQTTH